MQHTPSMCNFSPMHVATAFNNVAMIKMLHTSGANPMALTADGETSLDLAVWLKTVHPALALLEMGKANTNEFLISAKNGDVKTLKKHIKKMNQEYKDMALFIAARKGHPDCVKELIKEDASRETNFIGSTKKYSYSPDFYFEEDETENLKNALHVATKMGRVECIKALLEELKSEEKTSYLDMRTALGDRAVHYAVKYNRPNCLKLFLEEGVNPDIRGGY